MRCSPLRAWLVVPWLFLAAAAPESRDTGDAGADIVAAMVRAMGGAEALAGIGDSVSTSSVTLGGGQGEHRGDMTTEVLYPDRIRVTLSLSTGRMVQAFDGATAWLRAGQQTVALPPSMSDEMRRQIWLATGVGLVRAASQGAAQVRSLGQKALDGVGPDLEWTLGTERMTLWVDAETRLIRRVAYRAYSPQGPADVDVLWSDYRETFGVTVPWKTVTYRNHLQYSEVTLKTLRFNAALDPSQFSPSRPQVTSPSPDHRAAVRAH